MEIFRIEHELIFEDGNSRTYMALRREEDVNRYITSMDSYKPLDTVSIDYIIEPSECVLTVGVTYKLANGSKVIIDRINATNCSASGRKLGKDKKPVGNVLHWWVDGTCFKCDDKTLYIVEPIV